MRTRIAAAVSTAAMLIASAGFAAAATDPNVLCHRTVVKQLEKYKKTHLKLYRNCLDKENVGKLASCLDLKSSTKLSLTNDKVAAAIAKKCQMSNLATLGFLPDCHYGAATAGIGGTCFNLPVTTPTEFAECMKCWKGAEFARYIATLYASHAQEVCGTNLDDTSTTCSAVGCTSPLPDQRDLGDTSENDCQRGFSKASLNYLLKRERILEKCMLRGNTRGVCLADAIVLVQLGKAETQKETLIKKFCNNRVPTTSPPFCCRTGGMGQICSVAVDRNDCTANLSGTIMEGKFCGGTLACNGGANDGVACTVASECPGGACDGDCQNIPGPNKPFTWWEHCPTNESCPGPTMAGIDDVIDCVDSTADNLVDGLLCLQFPNGAACPTPVPTPTPTETPTPTPTTTP